MILHYVNGTTSECKVTKEGYKWIYFTARNGYGSRYRLNKRTGEVQIAPHWISEPRMYVTY